MNERNSLGALVLAIIVTTAAVCVSVAARPIVSIMAAREYLSAADCIPILAFAYVINALSNTWKFGIDFSLQTRFFAYATWISVAVMLLAYALLIPPFGAMGAAVATLIGFVARAIPTAIWAQRLFPLDYEWRRTAALVTCGAVAASVPSVFAVTGLLRMSIVSFSVLCAYAASVWWIVLGSEHQQAIRAFATSRWLAWQSRRGPSSDGSL